MQFRRHEVCFWGYTIPYLCQSSVYRENESPCHTWSIRKPKGGHGKNYVNDLKMEYLICANKVVLKDLVSNKTLTAVQRYSKVILKWRSFELYDSECNIHPELTKHIHGCTTDDVRDMLAVIHISEPFKHQPGRVLNSFLDMKRTILDQLNVSHGLHVTSKNYFRH